MDFRARVGDERFADVPFAALQNDPIGALAASYERIGLAFSEAIAARRAMGRRSHEPGLTRFAHATRSTDFGIDADEVRQKFAPYIAAFDRTGLTHTSARDCLFSAFVPHLGT